MRLVARFCFVRRHHGARLGAVATSALARRGPSAPAARDALSQLPRPARCDGREPRDNDWYPLSSAAGTTRPRRDHRRRAEDERGRRGRRGRRTPPTTFASWKNRRAGMVFDSTRTCVPPTSCEPALYPARKAYNRAGVRFCSSPLRTGRGCFAAAHDPRPSRRCVPRPGRDGRDDLLAAKRSHRTQQLMEMEKSRRSQSRPARTTRANDEMWTSPTTARQVEVVTNRRADDTTRPRHFALTTR